MPRDVRSNASPVLAVEQTYNAIRDYADPATFISIKDQSLAMAEAHAIERAGADGRPLFGMIFAVKDNIDVAGLPTTAACPAFSYRPERSAFTVARLEAAGAIAIGKTNLDQFATGLVGVRSPYGIPRNPLRADLIPGGSSSGSATSVAAGLVDFSLGTDTAGSGRIPAGMNGIVGLKPSLGLFSATGLVPACRTLDTISVFARSVQIALAATRQAAGFDPDDPYSKRLPLPSHGAAPPHFRAGIPRRQSWIFFGDKAAEKAYEADLETLAASGAEIIEIDFTPLMQAAKLLYEGPWLAERYVATLPLIESRPEALHETTRAVISGAKELTAADAFRAFYRLARHRRAAEEIFAGVDVLAVPTVPRFYTIAEVLADPIRLNSNLGTHTNFVNLLNLAAISVPVGERSDGLPSSLTLIGCAGSDSYLAAIGAKLMGEASPARPLRAAPGQIELVVLGAHMSGLPLNRELNALGAHFLRAAETRPDYRLYRLPGGPPVRPGLLRSALGAGASIAVEVWSLDAEGFGKFVAAIPAPLGIGTLALADGTEAKGFLVEAEAVHGAEDITSTGGWRNYLARSA